jgi:hypothetical protein
MLALINTRCEVTQRVVAAKLTSLTHKIAINLHLVAESYSICCSSSKRPVLKLLDTPWYIESLQVKSADLKEISCVCHIVYSSLIR